MSLVVGTVFAGIFRDSKLFLERGQASIGQSHLRCTNGKLPGVINVAEGKVSSLPVSR